MKISILLFFLCIPLLIFAENSTEISVELRTEQAKTTTYLGKIQDMGSAFSSVYLERLRQVLAFDLAQSGLHELSENNPALETHLKEKMARGAFVNWPERSNSFVIICTLKDKQLKTVVYVAKEKTLKNIQEVQLSGDLSIDRSSMHAIADTVQKICFQSEGICRSKILFSMQTEVDIEKKWSAEIWQCDYDGANLKRVTFDESYNISPIALSKERFFYVCYKNGQPKIFASSIGQKSGKPVISLSGNQLLPVLSPKQDKIAFICDAAGRADLFVQTLSPTHSIQGKPTQLFSYPNSTQSSPTFSPDGRQIAFVSDKDGSARVYLIESSNVQNKRNKPVLLTKRNRENTTPSWSPDGKKIAYSAKTDGIRQIWIYDFSTKEEKQLTFGGENKENPSWAQDSVHLVFNTTGRDSQLFIMNTLKLNPVQITKGPQVKHYPCWQKL